MNKPSTATADVGEGAGNRAVAAASMITELGSEPVMSELLHLFLWHHRFPILCHSNARRVWDTFASRQKSQEAYVKRENKKPCHAF